MHRCAASLLALVAFAPVRAAEPLAPGGRPVEIHADSVQLDSRRALYEARGAVEIRQGDRVLHAAHRIALKGPSRRKPEAATAT